MSDVIRFPCEDVQRRFIRWRPKQCPLSTRNCWHLNVKLTLRVPVPQESPQDFSKDSGGSQSILGLPAEESLGDGGWVRAFSETRFLTRLGNELAQRILLAGARLLLPYGYAVEATLLGTFRVPGKCWLRGVEAMMLELEIERDACVDWQQ